MGWDLLVSVFLWKGEPLHCFTCRTRVYPELFLSEADRKEVAMIGELSYRYVCQCGQVALIVHNLWEGTMTGEWLDMEAIKEAKLQYFSEMERQN